MRIGVDIRSLIEPFPSGVSVYTEQLVRAMVRLGGEHTFHLFCSGMTPVPDSIRQWVLSEPRVSLTHIRRPNKVTNLMHLWFGRPHLDVAVGGVDVWFMPNLMFGQVSRKTPVVVTAHDVSFRYPGFFPLRGYWWHRLVQPRHYFHAAARIIAVSENTKRDVVTSYGVGPEQVTVIPLGVDVPRFVGVTEHVLETIRHQYHLDRPYVLYMGAVNARKNIDGLLRAWEIVSRQTQGAYDLVIAGHVAGRQRRIQQPRVRFVEYIPESDKPAWYRGADAFVYPSYFEGFGLPVLEAMAAEVPVVTSVAPALGEVVGDAALMVDPYNASALSEALFRVLQDHTLRRKLVSRGVARVQHFSWDRTAQETLKLLLSVIPA